MADIIIDKLDEAYMVIHTDNDGILFDINDHFSFYAKNYKHMPKYKCGMWDGRIRLLNVATHEMHLGLVKDVIKFAVESGYTLDIDPDIHLARKGDTCEIDIKELTRSFNLPFKPHDYQIDAVERAMLHRRRLILSPTSSGKSLIIYTLIRSLLPLDKKVLLVVPTTSLVEQMVSDFKDYSKNNEFDADLVCHKIYSGKEKSNAKPVTVTTWQSVYNKSAKWFEGFDAVIVDEAHTASADSITKIMNKSSNAEYRIGLTGTIEDSACHELTLTGLFGPIHVATTTKEMMDRDQCSTLKIKAIIFDHVDAVKKEISKLPYDVEVDHIIADGRKNRFICKLALKAKGNTLVLFRFTDKHGIPLYEMMKSLNTTGKKIFYVDGSTKVATREAIRAHTESNENVIIVASYGTFSTGINIKNLENAIFAHPYKSKIKILQSIGRVLRKSANSSKATLYDIASDYRWKSKVNTTMSHFKERLKQYDKAQFEYSITKVKI